MATIQIRDVPESTHATLRRRAAEAGKSLQEYVLSVLKDTASKPTVDEVMRRAGGRAGGHIGFRFAAQALRDEREHA